jgi:hypothetical protein
VRSRQDHVDVRLAKLAISSRLAAFSIGVFLRPLFPASVLCCSLTHALAGLRVVKSVSQAVSADAAGDDSTALTAAACEEQARARRCALCDMCFMLFTVRCELFDFCFSLCAVSFRCVLFAAHFALHDARCALCALRCTICAD